MLRTRIITFLILLLIILPSCVSGVSSYNYDNQKVSIYKSLEKKEKNKSGATALMIAVTSNDMSAVQTLLNKGANVNGRDKTGHSALIMAAISGYNDIIHVLLNRGADINAQDTSGMTALIYAAHANHTDVVRTLLNRGVSVNLNSNTGATALTLAEKGGHTEIINLLKQAGAEQRNRRQPSRPKDTTPLRPAYAVQSTITEVEGYSCMGEDKSRKQTKREALTDAKRKAVEYALTYIKSESKTKNFQLEKDIVEAYSKADVKVLATKELGWYRDEYAGDCFKLMIKAEVVPIITGNY